MGGSDLVRLACEKINTARNIDERRRFGICGLSVASSGPVSRMEEKMAEKAGLIWHAVIQADIHIWKAVANEDAVAVGMSEEELIRRVENTAFVGLVYDFVSTAPKEGNIQNMGYLNDQVRNQVAHLFGSDELTNVLTLSAEIANATA